MPRPRKQRFCRRYRADRVFKPQGLPMRDLTVSEISLDEFEAMRLCDLEEMQQEQAGQQMGVSRGTVQRLLYESRRKILAAILNNDALTITLSNREAHHASMHTHKRKCRTGRHGK